MWLPWLWFGAWKLGRKRCGGFFWLGVWVGRYVEDGCIRAVLLVFWTVVIINVSGSFPRSNGVFHLIHRSRSGEYRPAETFI